MAATGVDVISNPKLLREPEDAMRSACWFWNTNFCNEAIDHKDMRAVTLIVNGTALMHLTERIAQFNRNLVLLGA
jgi:putative chitinase